MTVLVAYVYAVKFLMAFQDFRLTMRRIACCCRHCIDKDTFNNLRDIKRWPITATLSFSYRCYQDRIKWSRYRRLYCTFVQDSHLMRGSEDGSSQKLYLCLLARHWEPGISMYFSILRDRTNTSTLSSTHQYCQNRSLDDRLKWPQ